MLDQLKQVGFYTDCYGNRHWSEPNEVIDKATAEGILAFASVLCSKHETSVREIELWIDHVAPYWGTPEMYHGAVRFHEALAAEGLARHSPEEIRGFFGLPHTRVREAE